MKYHKLLDNLTPLRVFGFPDGAVASLDFRMNVYSEKYKNRLSSLHLLCVGGKPIPADKESRLYATTGIDYCIEITPRGATNPVIKIVTEYTSESLYIITPEQYKANGLDKYYRLPSMKLEGIARPETRTGRTITKKINVRRLGKKVNGWNAVDLYDLLRVANGYWDNKIVERAEFVPLFDIFFYVEKNDILRDTLMALRDKMPQENFTGLFGKEERFKDMKEFVQYLKAYIPKDKIGETIYAFVQDLYEYKGRKLVRKEDVIEYDE
ncbi:MAG: hypothetical protein K6A67_06150 [Bacteroidales bacterium]|nr:hypothetical protein [Bacteroidales bacterium]